MTTPASDKSYTTEQRLNAILQNGYPWPWITYNSSDHTGVNGTLVNFGTISTGANSPVLAVGQSYQVEAFAVYAPTANGPGNSAAFILQWTGSGAATKTLMGGEHFETGGADIGSTGNSSTNPFTNNNGSTSFGNSASPLPQTTFGPGMHSGNAYTYHLHGMISNVTVADTIELRCTCATATITIFAGCYIKVTPVNFAP